MPTTLYLFTYTFPYGTAESFLETEIEYLAAGWDHVVVVPSRLAAVEREVPGNVSVEIGLARALAGKPTLLELIRAVGDHALRSEVRRSPHVLTSRGHLRRLVGRVAAGIRAAGWIEENLPPAEGAAAGALYYTYWLSAATTGLARLKRSHPGLTLVSRAHGYDLYAERHEPAYLPLQREMIEGAERIFTISEHGRSYLAAKFPTLSSRIEVARLGVVDPGSVNSGSGDGHWRVLTCSSISAVKRVDLVVQALAELARRHPGRTVEWDHLGDGPLRPQIEAEATARLPSNVKWVIHGHVRNEDVLNYYRSRPVDVFVNVSSSEGIPVSIMEAQSFGVPAVATAVGGVPEIVDSSNGILLLPSAGAREVADALELVCLESQNGSRLRDASRASWLTRYNATVNYLHFVRRLQEIRENGRGLRLEEEGERVTAVSPRRGQLNGSDVSARNSEY